MNPIVQEIERAQILRTTIPFKPGDTVRVSVRIKEGEKERLQAYEGVVISIKGRGPRMRFTVRKLSYGVGVEKTFYYQSPLLKEVKLVRPGKVRRAKLYYLRERLTKRSARIEEGQRKEEVLKSAAAPEAPAEASTPQAAPEPAETQAAPEAAEEKTTPPPRRDGKKNKS